MDWDLQARFEHLEHELITSAGYLGAILNILDVLAGEKQASEMRRVVRKALFEGSRSNEESISHALRREQEFTLAEKYLPIPDELKGIMLEQHANLGKQGALNLSTLTGGSHDYTRVTHAGSGGGGSCDEGQSSAYGEPEDGEGSESSSIATQDEAAILAEIEKLDLGSLCGLGERASVMEGEQEAKACPEEGPSPFRGSKLKALWFQSTSSSTRHERGCHQESLPLQ